MEEERQEGVSLIEILSVIWKRIIWILAVSVVAALVCWLVVKFAVSPAAETYQLSFVLEYPNQSAEDNSKMQYPDGTVFRLENVFYAENLEAVKKSDESFGNLNVDKIASSVVVTQSDAQSDTQTGANVTSGKYTVTVSSSCFQDAQQATAFLKAVCEHAIDAIVDKAEATDFSAELTRYGIVTTFNSQIEILENQQAFLLAQYENYFSQYKYYKYEGKTLEAYRAEAAELLNGAVNLEVLKTDLSNNRYLHKETPSAVLTQIEALQIERSANAAASTALEEKVKEFMAGNTSAELNTSEGLVAYHNKISAYTDRNAQIDAEIRALYQSIGYTEVSGGTYEKTGDVVDSSAFVEKLTGLYDSILDATETCKTVIAALYAENTVFHYEQSGVSTVGAISALKYTAVVFVVVFVLACVVFCAVDFSRRKKAGANQSAEPKTAPKAEEFLAEAAVAETEKSSEEKPSEKKKK